ncbi:MAG: DUF3244 domain-containing protein [Candidatus Pacebacteria bacterium]|nr:DUF3244 domain-containing protein [Candidatus Paceibacterota bacterium]
MKKLLLFSFILFTVFIPITSQSSNFPLLNQEEDIERLIDLDGSLAETDQRSLLPTPIIATISTSSINVEFSNNLGIIIVEISSPSGSLIYDNNINTQAQTNLSIDVSGWDGGVYQIRFENSDGRYMYGTFEKE